MPPLPGGLAGVRRAAFWWGLPAVFAAILFWPTTSTVSIGDAPFSITLNAVVSPLPSPLADVQYHYPATVLALGVLALFAWRQRGRRRTVWLPTFALPTYLAGIESTRLAWWSLRCHSITDPPEPLAVVTFGLLLSTSVLLASIVAGALTARACGHRARLWLPIPPAAFAVLVGNALTWWLLIELVRPRGAL